MTGEDSFGSVLPEQQFFDHLSAGRFMLQRSRSTGQSVFYPRAVAPRTGESDLEWVPATGRGSVYATTVMRVKPPAAPYNVCLVELDEGCRMMSRVEGVPPERVHVGMRVVASIVHSDGERPYVVFRPAVEAAS